MSLMHVNMVLRRRVAVAIFVWTFLARCQDVTGDNTDTLELLQVLVRHGNRTSQGVYTQFMSEYLDTFQPFVFGELTPRGRRTVADFGKLFRKRYDDFLPREFSYEAVSVNCAAKKRVLETAMVGMAAMFPPKDLQKWGDSGLGDTWTPIVCQSVPVDQDVVYEPSKAGCSRYMQLQQDIYVSPDYLSTYNRLSGNGSVNEYIQRSLNMSTSEPLSKINLDMVWENLKLLESSEMPLPEWSKAVYPHPLTEIYHLAFWPYYRTQEIVMFAIGEYLGQVLNIAEQLEAKTLRPLSRKLFISFAHDVSIVPLLVALKLETNPPGPEYAAAFIMEMHRIPETQEIGFKFVYQNGTWQDPIIYTVPGCQEICPLRFVKQVVQDVIPPKPFYELCSEDDND